MSYNIPFMNLSSPIDSTLLQNKFLSLLFVFVVLKFWLSRPKRIWLQWNSYEWKMCDAYCKRISVHEHHESCDNAAMSHFGRIMCQARKKL